MKVGFGSSVLAKTPEAARATTEIVTPRIVDEKPRARSYSYGIWRRRWELVPSDSSLNTAHAPLHIRGMLVALPASRDSKSSFGSFFGCVFVILNNLKYTADDINILTQQISMPRRRERKLQTMTCQYHTKRPQFPK